MAANTVNDHSYPTRSPKGILIPVCRRGVRTLVDINAMTGHLTNKIPA